VTHTRSQQIARLTQIAVLAGFICGCSSGDRNDASIEFTGNTMGTSYSVTVADDLSAKDADRLQENIAFELSRLENVMSTYIEESELSTFNRNGASSWIDVSAELCAAIDEALQISRLTEGAFDITVGPLVNLWGFGPHTTDNRPPRDEKIAAALQSTGFRKLETDCLRPAIRKSDPSLYIDLSAYAKGLAVDEVSTLLFDSDLGNHLVEIGGEIRVRGNSRSRNSWRIAIEKPHDTLRTVQRVISLSDQALATSGNYRNFYFFDGERFSHTIDPRSGRPVDHLLAAVTVVGERAAWADAMATALLVMGPVAGPTFAEEHKIAALFSVWEQDQIREHKTTMFEPLVVNLEAGL
jgi:thiamine biosynthesis lipoprotein